MTIDTLTVLKALAAEASGTDGAGTALDLGGPWGAITAIITVTAVAGSPPSSLDLDLEGSDDNSDFFVVAKAPRISTPGVYRVPVLGIEAADMLTTTPAVDFRKRPRYLRKNSTVTAGTGGDGVTYSVHLTA
jgi:hypothetical protein